MKINFRLYNKRTSQFIAKVAEELNNFCSGVMLLLQLMSYFLILLLIKYKKYLNESIGI